MKFFRDRNVGTKIISGYIIALFLMLVVGFVALTRIGQISDAVNDLADNLAQDQHLADTMVSQIWENRFFALRYIDQQSQADLDRFNSEMDTFEEMLATADQEITAEARVGFLTEINEGVDVYERDFARVTELIANRDAALHGILDVQGPLAEEKLEQLRASAFRADDAVASHYAGDAQRALLLMRLTAFKYLEAGDVAWVEKFDERYQQARAAFAELDEEI